jgi:hypothetical protein
VQAIQSQLTVPRALQVEMRCQRREVIGVLIHVVVVCGLGGVTMAAAASRG